MLIRCLAQLLDCPLAIVEGDSRTFLEEMRSQAINSALWELQIVSAGHNLDKQTKSRYLFSA